MYLHMRDKDQDKSKSMGTDKDKDIIKKNKDKTQNESVSTRMIIVRERACDIIVTMAVKKKTIVFLQLCNLESLNKKQKFYV